MVKTTAKIEGMMCKNCERHMNEAIEKNFDVKKVTSSHDKKETVIISENELDKAMLEKTVTDAGYTFVSADSEPYKKGIFG